MDYTTTELLKSIKRRAFLPAASGLTDSDILDYASEELETGIISFLKSIREEFNIAKTRLNVSNGVVRIPSRASGTALRDIGWVLGDGTSKILARVELELLGSFAIGQPGVPQFYAFDGPNAVLMPPPTSGTVELRYELRPSKLVAASRCGVIASVSGAAATLTGLAAPSNIVTGSILDISAGTPGFEIFGFNLTASNVATNVVTFSESIATTLAWPAPNGGNPATASVGAPGCYISLSGETCIPPVPLETHRLLAQRTAVAILGAQGSDRLGSAASILATLEAQVRRILSPRDDASPRYVVSHSRVGRRWGWW